MPVFRAPSRRLVVAASLLCGLLPTAGIAAAQDAPRFSPTFAASHGSPYSAVYARTFGAPPLVTAAAPALPPAAAPVIVAPPVAPAGVVYIIEGGRLLTYSAGDYARGEGAALAGVALPGASNSGFQPDARRVPSVMDRLYRRPPLETAAGGEAPIPLLPQK